MPFISGPLVRDLDKLAVFSLGLLLGIESNMADLSCSLAWCRTEHAPNDLDGIIKGIQSCDVSSAVVD